MAARMDRRSGRATADPERLPRAAGHRAPDAQARPDGDRAAEESAGLLRLTFARLLRRGEGEQHVSWNPALPRIAGIHEHHPVDDNRTRAVDRPTFGPTGDAHGGQAAATRFRRSTM